MRVIAGKAKGHRLKSPPAPRIRPTSDLVRGAIFSMLQSLAGDWSRVLDLYAGTGALGIEALSRGAGWADFVEQDARSCAIIKENLERTKLAGQGKVYRLSVGKALSLLKGKYGILFLDPPYSDPSLPKTLERIVTLPLAGEDSTIVVEHSSRLPLEDSYGDFHLMRSLHHGDTLVSAYQFKERRSEP